MAVVPNLTELAMARMLGVDIVPPGAKKMRVSVASRSSGHAVQGTLVSAGTGIYEIYDIHLGEFEKLVEDSSLIELATRQYERDLEQFEAIKRGDAGTDEWRKQYEPSMPAAFRDMFKRDPLPFDAVEPYEQPSKRAA